MKHRSSLALMGLVAAGQAFATLPAPALILPERRKLYVPKEPGHVVRASTFDMPATAYTFDQATIDNAGSFLIGELERLDPTLHEPLVSVTWTRDIQLRDDVSVADEASSFTNSSFAAAGGINPNGKSWIGKDTNQITGIALDIGKTSQPLYLWGMELAYTIPELESAQRLGRPIDVAKMNGIKLKHNMDLDEQVYVGDSTLVNCYGLTNSPLVGVTNAAVGTGGSSMWSAKTADEKLTDVNAAITAVWEQTGYAQVPTDIRLPPAQFANLVTSKVSSAGNLSVLEFIKNNSITRTVNGAPINIQPLKWLKGRGVANSDRMLVYTNSKDRVRFPMTALQRTAVEYRSLFQITTYFGRIGQVEFVYPETLAYIDGI